jgi:hypothetical protein
MESVQTSWILGFTVKDSLVNRIIGFDKSISQFNNITHENMKPFSL